MTVFRWIAAVAGRPCLAALLRDLGIEVAHGAPFEAIADREAGAA
jgi:hypothetical protein